ncbi:MAG: hypothetical protein HOY78_02585 [Saccharothrix sp.]|jgi:hypothetical protein|nr:hypothetical protein [Saccharothrix sp.]
MTDVPVFPDTNAERRDALMLAVRLHEPRYPEHDAGQADAEMLATATKVWRWLTGPAYLLLHIGPVIDQETGEVDTTHPRGNPMQLGDHQRVELSIEVATAKGNEIPDDPTNTEDNLVWSVENGTDVIGLTVSEDSRTATVHAIDLGSAVVRVTVPGTEPPLFSTLAVDVVARRAARVNIRVGEPTDQPTEDEPVDGETPEA